SFCGSIFFAFSDNYIYRANNGVYTSSGIKRSFEVENNSEKWFDHAFPYYQKINIHKLTSDQIFISRNWAKFKIDHARIVKENKLRNSKGEDLRVVEYNGANFTEVPINIKNPNKSNTEISFKF